MKGLDAHWREDHTNCLTHDVKQITASQGGATVHPVPISKVLGSCPLGNKLINFTEENF